MVAFFLEFHFKPAPHVYGIINANAQRERSDHHRENIPLQTDERHRTHDPQRSNTHREENDDGWHDASGQEEQHEEGDDKGDGRAFNLRL